MEKENIYDYLLDIEPIPNELRDGNIRNQLIEFVKTKISTTPFDYKVMILNAGSISDKIYFVESGLVRGFVRDKKGKAKTVFLWDIHSLATDVKSFIQQTPSNLYLEVMHNSVLSSISREQLEQIFESFPYTRAFLDHLSALNNLYSSNSFYNFSKPSASERYQELLKRYPKVQQKVSKEIIASFLDITPQYLSKLIRDCY